MGTLVGHADDKCGDWDVYVRFDAVAGQAVASNKDRRRGDLVSNTPATSKAVLVRILGARKAGGKRPGTPRAHQCKTLKAHVLGRCGALTD